MTGRFSGLLAVLGVTVAAAGITAGSVVLPTADHARPSVGRRLPGSPSSPTLVCPGPETRLVPAGGQPIDAGGPVLLSALVGSSSGPSAARLKLLGAGSDSSVTPTLTATPTPAATTTGTPSSSPSETAAQTTDHSLSLTSQAAGVAVGSLTASALGPAVLNASTPVGAVGAAPSLAAVQSTLARSGDLRALTATACTVSQPDSWLVGGGTAVGERLRLLLANPASAPAVVDVDVHGPTGRVSTPSGEGVVVPPGAEVPIFIDALAPGLARVAVHVTTRAGLIRATMYDSLLHGLVPAGADDVPTASAPARRQIIPGVSLVDGDSRTAADPTATGSTAVRIAVPGSEEAVVRVRLLDSSGAVDLPQGAVVNVPAGAVVDVPISGLPSGTYTAVVDADVPVVAGALVGRPSTAGTTPASEFGWAGAGRPLTGEGYAVLPPGARSTLSLAAVGGAGSLTIQEIHADGTLADPIDLTVPAGTSITSAFTPDAVAVKLGRLTGAAVTASIVSTVSDPRGTLISVLPVALESSSAPPRSAVEDSRLGLH